jgi:hypothetical protein
MPRIKEKVLKTELAKHDFESVSVKRELPDGRVEVEANKLHPVHVEGGESIYAPIPVSLSVELDARGRVKSINGDTPNPAAIADAARYVKTLRDSGQLASAGEQWPASGLTWQRRRDCGVLLCMSRSHAWSTMADFAANGSTIHSRDAAYIT